MPPAVARSLIAFQGSKNSFLFCPVHIAHCDARFAEGSAGRENRYFHAVYTCVTFTGTRGLKSREELVQLVSWVKGGDTTLSLPAAKALVKIINTPNDSQYA